MKKITKVLLAASMLAVASPAMAESFASYDAQALKGYNRVGLNYNNTTLWGNDDLGLNGFGVYYTHGFHLTDKLPMFLEVGGGFNFLFHQDSEKEYGVKYTSTTSLITLEAPVNYIYRFNLGDEWTIAPFVGLNVKVHLFGQDRYSVKAQGTKITEDINIFDDDDMGGYEYNRFQMGWQTGVGFQYKPLYIGISYGTDFIPFNTHGDHVNTGTFKLNLGYSF